MRCRLYIPRSNDAKCLDRILVPGHDVRINRDRIIVAVDGDDNTAATLVWRPTAFIHEFDIPHTLGQKSIADSLMQEAIQIDFNRRHLIRQVAFLVDSDNVAMLRYIRDDVKAIEQPGVLFTLPLGELHESNG